VLRQAVGNVCLVSVVETHTYGNYVLRRHGRAPAAERVNLPDISPRHIYRVSVTAGHMAPTLGKPDPSQSRGDTCTGVRGSRIRSVRKGRWLSREKYVPLTHISNRSGGDPLVITPWLTNHNRDFETSLGLVAPRESPELRA